MIELRHLTKVFGRKEAAALAMAEQGAGKAEILAATGCTLALRDVTLDIAGGRGLRADGPVGLRQINPGAPYQPAD